VKIGFDVGESLLVRLRVRNVNAARNAVDIAANDGEYDQRRVPDIAQQIEPSRPQRSQIETNQAATMITEIGATKTPNRLTSVNLTGLLLYRRRRHVR
jgi:hypothetical protein